MALLMFISMGAASAANSTFTTSSIADSAGDVKTSVETNKALPTTVTVDNQQITQPQFLYLLAQGIQNIDTSSSNPADVTLKSVSTSTNPTESVNSGSLTKTQYISIANKLTTYINAYDRLPNYATTTLGTMRYENLVYTFSKVLSFYDTYNRLPNTVSVASWSSIATSDPDPDPDPDPEPTTTVTMSQVGSAASTVNSYYVSNKVLPSSVTVGTQTVSMSSLLNLLSKATVQANSGSTSTITVENVQAATNPSGSITSGKILKSEFVSIAQNIISYISANGKAPNYMSTSLGDMSFDNTVLLYSKIMNYYKTSNRLPNYVSMTASTTNPDPNPDPTPSTVTMSQVNTAAGTVKSYYETNKKLPNYVTIGTQQVTMALFLKLLTTATIQANSGSNAAINLETINAASNPYGQITTGSILKTEFLTVAQNILTYIGDNTKAPNYVTTSLGDMSFDNAVYMYSKIMNYYKTNARLPNTVSMTSSSSGNIIFTPGSYTFTDTSNTKTTKLGENSLGYVQKIGPFGTGTDKIALIIGVHSQETPVHVAMMNALKTLASSLNNVQIWVFEVYTNEIDSYTKSRSDGQTLANTYVVPNIDTSYKLAIDVHGNRGLYDVYDFIFAPSKGTSSVNYANQIISQTNYLKYYYVADGTSPAYVTIPIANKGIPSVVFELNMMVNNYRVVFYNKCLQVVQGLNNIFA